MTLCYTILLYTILYEDLNINLSSMRLLRYA